MLRTNRQAGGASRRRGFTLVEVLIASTLSLVVLAGVLSTFLMLGRSGYNAASYSLMEADSRRALEMFSQDARAANNVVWNSVQSVTLTVVVAGGTLQVTYAYNSGNKTFTRQATGGNPVVLARDVSEFAFRRYKVVNGAEFIAINDLETKQLQITLRTVRSRTTVVDATNSVLSARVVLRNKHVST